MSDSPMVNQQPVSASGPAVLIRAYDEMAADAKSLADAHDVFGELLRRNGLPPLWRREASFETLVRFILEQQVSLASANAAFQKLDSRLGGVTPEGVLGLTDMQMREDGFSRQKTGYVRGIADSMLSGEFEAPTPGSDTKDSLKRLLAIRGIGPWTAACYVLFVCGDRDTWPTGDRALYISMATNLSLADVPDRESADGVASSWAPWRSTAAKMLWYDYLGGRSHAPASGAGFIGGSGKVHS